MRRVLGKAATDTLNLGVGGAALLGAAALHSWPLLALGGLAYGALVAWDATSAAFWKKTFGRERPRVLDIMQLMPEPKGLADPAVRQAVTASWEAKRRLDAVLAETPATLRASLDAALAPLEELWQHAAGLARRADDLYRYLSTTDDKALQRSIAELTEKEAGTKDPSTRAEYARALQARQEQAQAVADLRGAQERVLANLAHVVALLEGLPPKLMRMRALDAQAVDALSYDMNDEIGRLNGEIRVFEETLKTLVEARAE